MMRALLIAYIATFSFVLVAGALEKWTASVCRELGWRDGAVIGWRLEQFCSTAPLGDPEWQPLDEARRRRP